MDIYRLIKIVLQFVVIRLRRYFPSHLFHGVTRRCDRFLFMNVHHAMRSNGCASLFVTHVGLVVFANLGSGSSLFQLETASLNILCGTSVQFQFFYLRQPRIHPSLAPPPPPRNA